MKISFVTAAYNAVATIGRAVESVSTAKRSGVEVEHIVVDDGSTDETLSILHELKTSHRHLVLVEQSNTGRSGARNAGLAVASGGHVVFLDSDDEIFDDFVVVMAEAARTAPNAVHYSDWVEIDSTGTVGIASANIKQGVFEETANRCPFAIHSCLVPIELARSMNGFDLSLDFAEDWDFWQRLARQGTGFSHVPQPLAVYHLHQRVITAEQAKKNYESAVAVIERAFETDPRVSNPVDEYRCGLSEGNLLVGASNLWAWFAGIEDGCDETFGWMREKLLSIEPSPIDDRSDQNSLAHSFVHGRWMARSAFEPTYPIGSSRLVELASHLSVDDPTMVANRLLKPERLPEEIGDQINLAASVRPQVVATTISVARIRLWHAPKVIPAPVGVFDIGGSDCVRFNPMLGLVKASVSAVSSRCAWIAAGRVPATVLRRPQVIKSIARRFAENVIDCSVAGSFSQPPTSPPKREELIGGFDDIFAVEDPWRYDEPYEVRKYEETLELIQTVDNLDEKVVAEIGCAEGHFTVRLAPLVERLTAMDISRVALDRTQERLASAEIENVETGRFDVRYDSPPADVDIIVCSELLYYMSRSTLGVAVGRMVDSLSDGGHLVHAHAFEASERIRKPGFGWRQAFGAAAISDAFASERGLQLISRIETDLYVVERYLKSSEPVEPSVEFRPIDRAALEPSIEQQVLWNSYATKPSSRTHVTSRLPVLCYHSVGSGAPVKIERYQISPDYLAEQLEWLRYHGYRSASVDEVVKLVRTGRPIEGRTVHLTFDDGYKDFDVNAWPVLQAYGFGATLFVPSSHIGQSAAWDSDYGAPLPLMDAERLRQLCQQGLAVGSHFSEHRRLTTLTTAEVLEGLRRSKSLLERLTGSPVDQVAYPYGDNDSVIQRLAGYCGYRLGFTTQAGFVSAFDRPLGLDRLVIYSDEAPHALFDHLPEPVRVGRFSRMARAGGRRGREAVSWGKSRVRS